MNGPLFRITFGLTKTDPGASQPRPAAVRLRKLLKYALRWCGLRNVGGVEEVRPVIPMARPPEPPASRSA